MKQGRETAPHAAAAADVSHPAQQGLVQAFSVYVDTIFVCTATGLMILFTNQYNVGQFDGAGQLVGYISEHIPGVNYTAFTQAAVSHHFPLIGNGFVAIALFFFAFTTVMAYYYYAEINLSYIFSNKVSPLVIWTLRVIFLSAVYFGSVKTAEMAWAIGDIGVGLMAYVNLIAILLMSKTALKVWQDYKQKRKNGEENPNFSAKALGIKNAEFWDEEK
ncbi:alanine:cation symporter family protein [Sphingobacterium sp. SG20118]|uniref:alanine:cation symporter family protein n=1 Tax=Sphingobacterium sp. SG20118 TaxID=3367156 RepID=UPI0037DFC6AB